MSPKGRGPHVPGNQPRDAQEYGASCALFAVAVVLAVALALAAFFGYLNFTGSGP